MLNAEIFENALIASMNEKDLSSEAVSVCLTITEDYKYFETFEECLFSSLRALSDGEFLASIDPELSEETVSEAFSFFEEALNELSFGYTIFNTDLNRYENIPELDRELDKIGYSDHLTGSIIELFEKNEFFGLDQKCTYEIREFETYHNVSGPEITVSVI